MEAILCWVGLGLLVYAFLLRRIFKIEKLIGHYAVVAFLHRFFYAACGALVGFVISASIEIEGPTLKFPLIFAMVGFIWALLQMAQSGQKEKAKELLAGDLELAETSYSAILLAALIMYTVVQAFKIPSGSMEDTLLIGDHLFVNKFVYGIRVPLSEHRILKWRNVNRHDVVVFDAPPSALKPEERERNVHRDFIKRAIGLPGDKIEIQDKQLFVNDQHQVEPYVVHKKSDVIPGLRKGSTAPDYQRAWQSGEFVISGASDWMRDNFGPIVVPPDSYFVMGDNRDGSHDSRFWGPVPKANLKGKAWLVYWPPSWWPSLRRWLSRAIPVLFGQEDNIQNSKGIRVIR